MPETLLDEAAEEFYRKAWGEFVNCEDDRYFGNRTKMEKQLDVLRKHFVPRAALASLQPDTRGFAPCPTCKQYSHSIGEDKLAAAFMHFHTMFSHRGDGIPTQYRFDEETRDAAQALMVAARGASLQPSVSEMRWQPIETAPKDGTWILAVLGQSPNEQLAHLAGRIFQIRHEGIMEGGYDLGWSLCPGHGGVPDRWFDGWMPLPPALSPEGEP